jgi:hypothetical protein
LCQWSVTAPIRRPSRRGSQSSYSEKLVEEDGLIARGVESMGTGKEISGEQFLDHELIEWLDNLEQYRLKFDGLESRLKDDGLTQAVDAIGEAVL